MAGDADAQFSSPSYLTANQQDLLMAALNSNHTQPKSQKNGASKISEQLASSGWDQGGQFGFTTGDPLGSGFPLDGQELSLSNVDGTLDDSSFLDFLDTNADGNDDFGGDLDEGTPEEEYELHEKRKSVGNDETTQETDAKRHEPEEKVAKKPGRKPLMTEPTNKRKAQNRAAQRAFRDRKEKHLKDLENKVAELEKASETSNNENSVLRAQVNRLQTELREYRKRMSLNASSLGRSPSMSDGLSSYLAGNPASNNFSFDFPRFGSTPSSGFVSSPEKSAFATVTNPSFNPSAVAPLRQNSTISNSPSNPSRANSTISQANSPPQQNTNGVQIESINNDGLNGLLGGSKSNTRNNSADTIAPHSRIFQFNSNAASTASPSASSNSQFGSNSSCATSPEPTQLSPAVGNMDASLQVTNMKYSGAPGSGTLANGAGLNGSNTITSTDPSTGAFKGIDWFAAQNGGQFDPTLFGDYRDSQVAIVGDGDFTGGFFDNSLPIADFSSPFNWDTFPSLPTGFTPAVQKPNPLEQADLLQAGVEPESVAPPTESSTLMNCNSIWDKLQSNPGFKDGSFDIDNLCSELRAKAKCSEGGVVIDQKDVDAALKRMPAKSPSTNGHQLL